MNSQDLKNLIDYIMENNSQKEASFITRGRRQYKYVDFRLDTRDGSIFSVIFRNGKDDNIQFEVLTEEDLQKIYDWLDKEVSE
jgi:hypothetical protein